MCGYTSTERQMRTRFVVDKAYRATAYLGLRVRETVHILSVWQAYLFSLSQRGRISCSQPVRTHCCGGTAITLQPSQTPTRLCRKHIHATTPPLQKASGTCVSQLWPMPITLPASSLSAFPVPQRARPLSISVRSPPAPPGHRWYAIKHAALGSSETGGLLGIAARWIEKSWSEGD